MDLGGGDAGDFGVGGAVGFVARFAEAGGVGGQELRGVAGDGVGEGGDAAFDGHVQVEGGVGVLGVGQFDDDGAAGARRKGSSSTWPRQRPPRMMRRSVGRSSMCWMSTSGRGLRQGQRLKALAETPPVTLGEGAAHLVALGGVAGDEFVVEVGHGEEGGAGGADVGDEVWAETSQPISKRSRMGSSVSWPSA